MKRRRMAMMAVLALAIAAIGLVTLAAGHDDEDDNHGSKLKLTDAYLSTFTYDFGDGSASLVSVLDQHKKGVGFAVTDLSKIGISDKFVVPTGLNPLSGCIGAFNGDCSAFGKLTLEFKNLGTKSVDVNVYMNTGFTGGGFGIPTDDIYWQGQWTTVEPGKHKKVTLDFSNAEAYNCDGVGVDGCDNGPGQSILRLDEVSAIGFQVADWSNSDTATWVVVKGK